MTRGWLIKRSKILSNSKYPIFPNLNFRVENDVTLLKNRVRMLKQEHDKAEKKIRETNAKAEKLEKIRADNDRKFIRNQQAEERK